MTTTEFFHSGCGFRPQCLWRCVRMCHKNGSKSQQTCGSSSSSTAVARATRGVIKLNMSHCQQSDARELNPMTAFPLIKGKEQVCPFNQQFRMSLVCWCCHSELYKAVLCTQVHSRFPNPWETRFSSQRDGQTSSLRSSVQLA